MPPRRYLPALLSLTTLLVVQLPQPASALDSYPGSGKRVIYSRSANQVWLINADETVYATWKVTGNPSKPSPGTYRVYSRSSVTRSIDGRYTFTHMVRFARARSGVGIGFHAVPYNTRTKSPIMPLNKIGSHRYHSGGCVRQSLPNAERMWAWASLGTQVVVLK